MTVKDKFDDLQEYQKVAVWNDYAEANYYHKIFDNDCDTIDMYFAKPSNLLRALGSECYEPSDTYFLTDDSDFLVTFSYIEDCPEFYWSTLEKWLISEEYDLDNL